MAAYFLVLAGGPKVFLPAKEYNLKLTVNMTIDGRSVSHVGGVKCSVKDQRGSIAPNGWHIEEEVGLPYFLRADGGAVILSGSSPCNWRETSPEQGVIYRMDLLGNVYDKVGAKWGDLAFWGQLRLLDDVTNPQIVRTIPLAHADNKTIWGVRIDGVTLEVADVAVDTGLERALPAQSNNPVFTMVQAAVETYHDVQDCTGLNGDRWMLMPADNSCPSSRGRFLPVAVSPDYGQINIGSFAAPMKDPDLGILTGALIASGQGQTSPTGGSFTWQPRLCIEAQCFDTNNDVLTQRGFRVVNPARNLVVKLNYQQTSTAQWLG